MSTRKATRKAQMSEAMEMAKLIDMSKFDNGSSDYERTEYAINCYKRNFLSDLFLEADLEFYMCPNPETHRNLIMSVNLYWKGKHINIPVPKRIAGMFTDFIYYYPIVMSKLKDENYQAFYRKWIQNLPLKEVRYGKQ